jgi:ABC-type amino acid transport substrate-binding protein
VLVGDISTTRKRLDKVDFSRPYFINTISMAVKKHPLSFSQLLKHYLSLKIINIILWMLLLFVIIANLLWVVEHRKNQAIEKKYFRGIMSVMWVMVYNLLRGGPFSKPESRAGKNLILIWLVIGFISLVLIAANITSELTMHKIYNYSDYSKLSELRGKTAIVVRGRLSVAIAKSLNLNIKIADNLQQAITLLKSSQAALIIEDYNILKLALDKSTHPNIFISSLNIKYDEYAFATRINSTLLPMINKGITRLQDSGQALNICKEYLDDSQSRFCEL